MLENDTAVRMSAALTRVGASWWRKDFSWLLFGSAAETDRSVLFLNFHANSLLLAWLSSRAGHELPTSHMFEGGATRDKDGHPIMTSVSSMEAYLVRALRYIL